MNEQHANTKSASPLGKGERIEVRGVTESSESDNPHPTLSLEKGEATARRLERKRSHAFDKFMNEQPSKIYLLPNLMTAGNLFCGFTATLKILENALLQSTNADLAADHFHETI